MQLGGFGVCWVFSLMDESCSSRPRSLHWSPADLLLMRIYFINSPWELTVEIFPGLGGNGPLDFWQSFVARV